MFIVTIAILTFAMLFVLFPFISDIKALMSEIKGNRTNNIAKVKIAIVTMNIIQYFLNQVDFLNVADPFHF